jgi:zinc/manganese transport system substrate-binding protein
MRVFAASAVLLAASLALSGCATTSTAKTDGRIRVVASTNVYGDIARQIGGSLVSVDSIIDDPSQDPHSYEADAQVQLALSHAQVVVENGGGYDDFVDTLLKGASNSGVSVLNVASISGRDLTPSNGEFNEHLWFDYPTVAKLAERLASRFARLNPKGAAQFTANAKKFDAALAVFERDERDIKASSAGEGVAITEPVPLYLLDAAGLVNKTPVEFSEGIENGTDVSPVVLKDTLALFSDHRVKLLAYNEQTSGAQTEQVLAAAKAADIPIVPVRETLPAGKDYLEWMTDVIGAVKAGLKR